MDSKPPQAELATTVLDIGIFDYAAIGIAYLDTSKRFLRANRRLQELLGYKDTDLKTLNLDDIVHPEDRATLDSAVQEVLDYTRKKLDLELRCFDAKGYIKNVRLLLSVFGSSQYPTPYLIALIEPASSVLTDKPDALYDRKLFETIAENVPTTVWLASIDMKTLHYVNQAFLDTWGISKQQVASGEANNLLDRVHPDDQEKVRELIENGPGENDSYVHNFRLLHEDGSVRYLEDRGTILRDARGEARFVLGTHRDMTERVTYTSKLETLNQELQEAYEQVTRLNQYDPLTGAMNRRAILKNIANSFYQFKRYEIPASIIYIDLNRFKEVNDDHGHLAGDMVLKNFVQTMQERIRESDVLGRMGGDEFLLLLPGTTGDNAIQFLNKAPQSFDTSIEDGKILRLHFAAGIAELDYTMQSLDAWIDVADQNMYQQKNG
ncbi:MAG: diguanylate cyclase [Gammaproteobacteria bacterium]|nr:diguanylate cyclase [Gammaproteobacteria bacterium]NNC98017.1 diguanylate cyclase [Gammaproteobacteria bacterium]NNM13757.1 diguanylate cyclase [Gammaproteobacteria bacterium]